MTAVATKLLHDFKTLDPEEQLLVREHVLAVMEGEQRKAVERLRGSGKGEHLLEKLLKDRTEELARGG